MSDPHGYDPAMEVKRCTKCLQLKSLDEFYVMKVNPKGTRKGDTFINPVCKVCLRAYSMARYANDTERIRALQKTNEASLLLRNRQYAWDYLSSHPCVDCGEDDVLVLEFDHVRGEKEFAVAVGVAKKYSIERLAAEIAKCDIRCANCHRRRTAGHMGWYANMLSVEEDPDAA